MSGILAALIGAAGGFALTVNITADRANFNLRTEAIAAGWNQLVPLVARVNIASGVVVYSSSASLYAFDTGTTAYPEGSNLTVNSVGAFIVGLGGNGSTGGGGNGSTAVRVNLPTTWDNASGTIGGGGGGGGGGQTRTSTFGGDSKGTPPTVVSGIGGSGGGGRTGRTNSSPNGTFASAGSGFGGGTQTASGTTLTGGTGGSGGSWGVGGNSGGVGSGTGPNLTTSGPFSGGAPGGAIVGNSWITWLNTGTRLGTIA